MKSSKRNQIPWYLKQLLPLRYHTTYKDVYGKTHYTKWMMWFGRCFNTHDHTIDNNDNEYVDGDPAFDDD